MKDNNEKAIWVIGIALIIFLILLGGSLIGLKLTRDGANKVLNNGGVNPSGRLIQDVEEYTVLEDGTKKSTNKDIAETEIDNNGIVFSNFAILERPENENQPEGTVYSEVDFDIKNTTNEMMKNKTFVIKLYGDDGNMIQDLSVFVAELGAGQSTRIANFLYGNECILATKVEVADAVSAQAPSGE